MPLASDLKLEEAISPLLIRGFSVSDIAKMYGVHRMTVNRKMEVLGIKSYGTKKSPLYTHWKQISDLSELGYATRDIADFIGARQDHMRNFLIKNGFPHYKKCRKSK